MAKRHPSRTAVITGDGGVASYDEVVHRKVDVITTELEAVGITTGSRVAVLQEPTADWVSSILAVMRIGAIYLPLDLGIPWSRLAAIVKDCQPAAVLVDDQTISHVHKLGCEGTNVVSISNKHRATDIQILPRQSPSLPFFTPVARLGRPKGSYLHTRGCDHGSSLVKFYTA